MSWLSDRLGINIDIQHNIEDVTHSIGSVFQSAGEIIAAPVRAIGEAFRGENIGDAFKNAGSRIVGNAANIGTGGAFHFITDTDSGKSIFDSKLANQLSFGLSSGLSDLSKVSTNLAEGTSINNLNAHDVQGATQFGLKAAAIALTAGGAAAAVGVPASSLPALTFTNYGVAQAGYSAIQKGDILGAASSIAGGYDLGVPTDLTDTYNTVKDGYDTIKNQYDTYAGYLASLQSRTPAPVQYNPWSSPQGAIDGVWRDVSSPAGIGIGTIALVLAGVYFLRRGK